MHEAKKHYSNTGGPEGPPFLGVLRIAARDPMAFLVDNAIRYGDIIPYNMLGRKVWQVNHPDLVRYVLMENHKNYYKSKGYIRFESVLGKGVLTSNGDKWKRDRQKIQPMFKRELVEGYYFEIVTEVSEKFKKRWMDMTRNGPATINLSDEMSAMMLEIIVKIIFGSENMDDESIASLHRSYRFFLGYLKGARTFPKVDMRKMFHTPYYKRFVKELASAEAIFTRLKKGYENSVLTDKYNMLALLVQAKRDNPEHFSDLDIRDQTFSMVLAGFETTSLSMSWMWYAMAQRPDIAARLRKELPAQAPCLNGDSSSLAFADIAQMPYLNAVFQETMRVYPPFWLTGRDAVAADVVGGYEIAAGDILLLPQLVMHRHPRFWELPDAFIPERFMPENVAKIDDGLFFPFSQGPRKCSGYKLAEMEALTIFSKFLCAFDVTLLNTVGNGFDPGISMQPTIPFMAKISRLM